MKNDKLNYTDLEIIKKEQEDYDTFEKEQKYRKQISKIMNYWYYRTDVMFEIIKQTYNKELSFLMPKWCDADLKKMNTRMMKCHNTIHYTYILNNLHIIDKQKPYNFYYTIASYKNGIPNQNMSLGKRDNSKWRAKHFKHIESYDFLIDVDCDSLDDFDYCFESAKMISELFDKLKVPHSIRFSGRGFHFVIPFDALPKKSFDPHNEDNLYKFLSMISKKLYNEISEMIDTTIYDSRRLCKIPYSLAIFENNVYVCYPFQTKQEFYEFELKNYTVDAFAKPIKEQGTHIFNRGETITSLLDYLRIVNFDI